MAGARLDDLWAALAQRAARAHPVRAVERPARVRPPVVAAALPHHRAGTDPDRTRDRERHLHPSLAHRRAGLHGRGGQSAHHPPRRAAGRPHPVRPAARGAHRRGIRSPGRAPAHLGRRRPRRGRRAAPVPRRQPGVRPAVAGGTVRDLCLARAAGDTGARGASALAVPCRRMQRADGRPPASPTRRSGARAPAISGSPPGATTWECSRSSCRRARRRASSCRMLPGRRSGSGSASPSSPASLLVARPTGLRRARGTQNHTSGS